MIPHDSRVLKIYEFSSLNILKVKITLGTLWGASLYEEPPLSDMDCEDEVVA